MTTKKPAEKKVSEKKAPSVSSQKKSPVKVETASNLSKTKESQKKKPTPETDITIADPIIQTSRGVEYLVIGDIHLGAGAGNSSVVEYQTKFFEYICEIISTSKITRLIQLGDWYDNKRIPSTAVVEFSNNILRMLSDAGIEMLYHLDGNHDLYDSKKSTLSSFHEIHGSQQVGNMLIVSVSKSIYFDHKNKFIMVPYLSEEIQIKFDEMIEQSKDGRYLDYFLFGHFDIVGFKMRSQIICEHGLPAIIFKMFRRVVSGHYHDFSEKDGIIYLGSPYEIDWHDFGNRKVFSIIDFEAGKIEYRVHHSQFYKKVLYQDDGTLLDVTTNSPIAVEELRNKVVKIYAKDFNMVTPEFEKVSRSVSEISTRMEVVDHRTIGMSSGSDIRAGSTSQSIFSNDEIIEIYFNHLESLPENQVDDGQILRMQRIKQEFMNVYDLFVNKQLAVTNETQRAKITFKKMIFRNFYSFGNIPTEIDLNINDLILISGLNGRGKTTILEALYVICTGESMRGVNKDELINNVNKKGTELALFMDMGSDSYIIERGIKPNYLKLTKNGEPVMATGTPELEKKIRQFMPDGAMLKQSILISMMDYIPFMRLKIDKRRAFVEEYFETEIFNQMCTHVRSIQMGLSNEIRTANTKIDNTNALIETNKNNKKEWETHKNDQIQSFDISIEDNTKKINSNKILIEELNKELVAKNEPLITTNLTKCKDLQTDLAKKKMKAELKIAELDRGISFYRDNDRCFTCSKPLLEDERKINIDAMEKLKLRLKNAILSFDNANAIIVKDLGAIEISKQEINNIASRKSILQSEITILDQQNSNIAFNKNEQLKKIETFESQINEAIAKYEKQIEDLKKSIGEYQEKNLIYDYLLYILDDKKGTGIKNAVIEKWIAYIEVEANKYLDLMSAGFCAKIDSKFDVAFLPSNKKYEALSSGEKQRFDLALLFVFNNIANFKNSSMSSNLIFFDEVLDSSLDSVAIAGLISMFRSLVESHGKTCYVISHKDEIKSMFNKRIELTKDSASFTQLVKVGF